MVPHWVPGLLLAAVGFVKQLTDFQYHRVSFAKCTQLERSPSRALIDALIQQQAVISESNRRLSQRFEEVLTSPLLKPARLRLASSTSVDSEKEEKGERNKRPFNKRKANSPLGREKFLEDQNMEAQLNEICLLYTSPSPRD